MFREIAAAVRSRIAAATLGVPVAWPNERYAPIDEAPWIYAEVEASDADCTVSNSVGKRLASESVVLSAHVFVPVGTGTGDAFQIAESVAALFRALTFPADGFRVSCGAPVIADAAPGSDDGNWFRVTVSCPMTAHRAF